jgi:hypothetical protein
MATAQHVKTEGVWEALAVIEAGIFASEARAWAAIEAKAEQIRAAAESNAPVGATHKLADSVKVGDADRSKLEKYVGTDIKISHGLPIGRWMELGTVKMAPRPWLFPAAETHRASWPAQLAAAIGAAFGV